MRYKFLLAPVISLIICSVSMAASLNLPTQQIGNKKFYIYKVGSKETIYGISKKLNIPKEDIIKYNPSVAEGLKAYQTLFFPVEDFKTDSKDTSGTAGKFHHVVQRGETLYGLSKLYNISPDDIVTANPGASDGIKSGQVLVIPQKKEPVESPAGNKNIIYHTIQKGETLYRLSLKYNTTIENILTLNPGLSPSSYKADDVIKIQPDIANPEDAGQKPSVEFIAHNVNKKESFESIAKKYGVTSKELKQTNPEVEKPKKGNVIYVPQVNDTSRIDTVANEVEATTKINEIYSSIHETQDMEIDIALLLPFMLNNPKPDKQAQLYTEFYQGFLMAVDSIRKTEKKKINIYAYDTEGLMTTVSRVLAKPGMKSMDIIFTPDDVVQIGEISKFAKENDINVINTFSIKNDGYTDNEHFFQVNVPHSYMYAEVVHEFGKLFPDREIIFLYQADSEDEEKDFVKEIKDYITANNINSRDITFSNILQASDIEPLMAQSAKYVIVPTSGSRKFLSKITTSLKKIKAERPDLDFVLFGYPEWTTYEDYNDTFQKLDTYLYTRFYADPSDERLKDFERRFKYWYGSNMIDAAPQFGLLGFDTGMYFLKAMGINNNDFNKSKFEYNGIQNDFKFERVSNWSGFINKSIYFIHFTPYSAIEKVSR